MIKKIKDISELQKICTPLEVNTKIVDKINKLGSSPQHSSEEVAIAFKKIYERLENMKNKQEMVEHPSHYGGADNPYEAIKVIEAWEANFNIGTTLRYLCRCGKKTIGGSAEEMRLEDLKKARWYLDREIQNIEKGMK